MATALGAFPEFRHPYDAVGQLPCQVMKERQRAL
jgi:hypothetical protein